MKKILVGSFQCESNTFASHPARRKDFLIEYGDKVITRLVGCRILQEAGFTCVPMPYAIALPSGKVCRDDYLGMLDEFLKIAAENTDACGIYLYFHGAMYVDGIGSGEEYCVKELRKIVGNDIPIAVASDFHSNVSDGLLENINAISGFRTAPHTDYDETEYRAAKALVKIIKGELNTKMRVFRVPALLADVAQTAKEPYNTALKMLKDIDRMDGVVTAALYNGQPWVDAPYVGISVVVSYYDNENAVCSAAEAMANHIREHLTEFKFDCPAMMPIDALEAAKTMEKPVFLSDSGDNTTAGADGRSTFFTEKVLESGLKNVLVASICIPELYKELEWLPVGSDVDCFVPAQDRYSKGFNLKGKITKTGTILGFVNEEAGKGIVVSCEFGDVVVSSVRTSFITEEHFEAMGIVAADYDAVILKIGYLWPRTAPLAASKIFALTPGVSTNDFSTLDFKDMNPDFFYVK